MPCYGYFTLKELSLQHSKAVVQDVCASTNHARHEHAIARRELACRVPLSFDSCIEELSTTGLAFPHASLSTSHRMALGMRMVRWMLDARQL